MLLFGLIGQQREFHTCRQKPEVRRAGAQVGHVHPSTSVQPLRRGKPVCGLRERLQDVLPSLSLFFFFNFTQLCSLPSSFHAPGLRHIWKSLKCLDRKRRGGCRISVSATNSENTLSGRWATTCWERRKGRTALLCTSE